MQKHIDVVGAGFSGATVAHELAKAGYIVNLYERRHHIAGNAYDTIDAVSGIRYHVYGPHLFHTKNERVWKYLQQFGKWDRYKHKVKALLPNGQYVTLPVNRETASIVGEENIIETFYRPYSEKMWGMKLEDIDKSILDRVKIRDDDNEYYFPDDPYQALPVDGYTSIVSAMLRHPNINLHLQTDYDQQNSRAYHTFSTAPIDVWFDNMFGALPYRSIKFERIISRSNNTPPAPVINFTHTDKHTRCTVWNMLPHHNNPRGTLRLTTFEEPCSYEENNYERYYPVKDPHGKNREIYRKYSDYAKENSPNVTFLGRCGSYQYLDMDMAINQALQKTAKFITKENKCPV